MSFRDKVLGRPEDVKASKAADRALNESSDRDRRAGIHDETPEYLELNAAAVAAAAKLPRHRR
jgi:hypothetical protein